MARVTVKLFGVLRVDTHLAKEEIDAGKLEDIFDLLNRKVDEIYQEHKKMNSSLKAPDKLSFKDAVVFINGKRVSGKHYRLKDGEEIWLMSPASGG